MHSGPVLCPWKSPQTVSVSLWLCSHVHAVSRHALSACHTLGFVDAEADGIPAFTIMLSVMGASYRGRAAEPKTGMAASAWIPLSFQDKQVFLGRERQVRGMEG